MCMRACVLQYACAGQARLEGDFWESVSPATFTLVWGIELMSLGLQVANAFTHHHLAGLQSFNYTALSIYCALKICLFLCV